MVRRLSLCIATTLASLPLGARLLAQGAPASEWIRLLGIRLTCTSCTLTSDSAGPKWDFRQLPAVAELIPSGPAADVGMSVGDTIRSIDGYAITTEGGGRRFANLKIGHSVRLIFFQGRHTGLVDVTPSLRPIHWEFANPPVGQRLHLPDTPPGRAADGRLRVVNSDDSAIRAFAQDSLSPLGRD